MHKWKNTALLNKWGIYFHPYRPGSWRRQMSRQVLGESWTHEQLDSTSLGKTMSANPQGHSLCVKRRKTSYCGVRLLYHKGSFNSFTAVKPYTLYLLWHYTSENKHISKQNIRIPREKLNLWKVDIVKYNLISGLVPQCLGVWKLKTWLAVKEHDRKIS